MLIDNHPKNPAVVDKLTNQLQAKAKAKKKSARILSSLKTKDKNALENRDRPSADVHERQPGETRRCQHGSDRQALARALGEDHRCLSSEGETVEDTGGAVEERVAGRKGGGEDGSVDDRRERGDACVGHGDDVGGLGGRSGACKS